MFLDMRGHDADGERSGPVPMVRPGQNVVDRQLGGSVQVCMNGTYAYFGMGPRLLIVDILDPPHRSHIYYRPFQTSGHK
jgi:hypothetical protein